MRSAEEYITDLQTVAAAESLDPAALVVGYEDPATEFVWLHAADALETLSVHLLSGGVPLAIFGIEGPTGRVMMRVLEEFAEDEEIEKRVISALAAIRDWLREQGYKPESPIHSEPGRGPRST